MGAHSWTGAPAPLSGQNCLPWPIRRECSKSIQMQRSQWLTMGAYWEIYRKGNPWPQEKFIQGDQERQNRRDLLWWRDHWWAVYCWQGRARDHYQSPAWCTRGQAGQGYCPKSKLPWRKWFGIRTHPQGNSSHPKEKTCIRLYGQCSRFWRVLY